MKLLRFSCDLAGPFLTLDSEGSPDIPERIEYDGQAFTYTGMEGPGGLTVHAGYDSHHRLYRYRHVRPPCRP